jgi:hypothetical protein
MRETRSSGSVEGVVGNHDSYSDPCSLHPQVPQEDLVQGTAAVCRGILTSPSLLPRIDLPPRIDNMGQCLSPARITNAKIEFFLHPLALEREK